MTVENLEANGNHSKEENTEDKAVESNENKGREALALSVNERTMLPNNRPIEPSHLDVVGTYSAVGGSRPISKSGIDVSSSITISGKRPIAVSTLNVSDTYTVMGNRPVASNEIDDPTMLMGYLD